jgi:salicylate hydroxylase
VKLLPFKIAIVGAGTAGLAAAAFLARDYHDVTVFEKFAAPKPLGAGLLIQPTGLACLAALGVDDAALALGHRIDRIEGQTAAGRQIFDIGYGELGPNCFGLAMHRAALFQVLWDAVAAADVSVTAGTDIVATSLTDGYREEPGDVEQRRAPNSPITRHSLHGRVRWLKDSAGKTHGPFHYVIDASGLRSRLRQTEAAVRLNRPYPYGAVWGALELPRDWPHRHALTQRYDGAHTMCGILPIGRRPGEMTERAAFFWSLRVADFDRWRGTDLDDWKRRVSRLWPEVQPFLDQIRRHDDLTAASYADIWLKRPYAEKLVFIGDAARAASPQLGQGANLALIDALHLACVLSPRVLPLEGPAAAYAWRRRAHTRFYGLASRALTPFFQSDSRLAARVRDMTFAPMARIPYVRREMVRTLAGMKTGLFTSFDPGSLHPSYALSASPRRKKTEPLGGAHI